MRQLIVVAALATIVCDRSCPSSASADTILPMRLSGETGITVLPTPGAVNLPFTNQWNEFVPMWPTQFPAPGPGIPLLQSLITIGSPTGNNPGPTAYIDFHVFWPEGVTQAAVGLHVNQLLLPSFHGSIVGLASTPTSSTSAENLVAVEFHDPTDFQIHYKTRTDVLWPGATLQSTLIENVYQGNQSKYDLRFIISKPADVLPIDQPLMRLTFTEVSTPLDAIYVPEPGSGALAAVAGAALLGAVASCRQFRRRRKSCRS